MATQLWAEIDDFITGHVVKQDAELRRALLNSAAASLPPIQVGAAQGKLLWLLGRAINARRILEIGTLGGYSTIWLAKALPASGRLISMELDARHAAVARENIAQVGLADRVQIVQGEALVLLPLVDGQNPEGFDLVFIDADKPNSPRYYEWAVKLTRPGGVIVADNVVREGAVIASARDASAEGVRRMLEAMGSDERVSATVIQTVGGKGHDGFAIALRTGEG
jgi:predicted O-methyltransferase YrrM